MKKVIAGWKRSVEKRARDKATDQLREFAECQRGKPEVLTTANGAPIGSKTAIMTAGARGPQVLQDFVFLDEMSHFGQERIPERVVHAKGAGAKGVFEVTKDISKYSKAKVFEVNKKTPLFVRFSTVGGERGSADTARDPRGFAIKMYTEEGNWDLVGNNTPIFFIRDPIFFPSFIHTQKRNPKTNLKDPDMFWDFISLRPETTHQVCFLFSDRGTPDGFRFMDGFGSHTFKLVNKRGEVHFCKFHLKTDQGIKNLPAETADKLQGTDPDYATRDLYNAIEDKNFPSWTFKIQVMTEKEAESVPFNPFDVTKTWSQTKYPLIEVGKLTLHTNPDNYHAEVEQAAFSPAHMPPGIEASPDKMLQGRLFSYSDTHRHRLGTNYQQIPVNQPRCQLPHTYQRDGPQTFLHMGGAPNYFPNSFGGADHDAQFLESSFKVSAEVKRYETRDEDNFSQVTVFWEKVLDEAARNRLVNNIAGSLVEAQEFIRKRAVSNFAQVHRDFGKKLESRLDELLSHKKAAKL